MPAGEIESPPLSIYTVNSSFSALKGVLTEEIICSTRMLATSLPFRGGLSITLICGERLNFSSCFLALNCVPTPSLPLGVPEFVISKVAGLKLASA